MTKNKLSILAVLSTFALMQGCPHKSLHERVQTKHQLEESAKWLRSCGHINSETEKTLIEHELAAALSQNQEVPINSKKSCEAVASDTTIEKLFKMDVTNDKNKVTFSDEARTMPKKLKSDYPFAKTFAIKDKQYKIAAVLDKNTGKIIEQEDQLTDDAILLPIYESYTFSTDDSKSEKKQKDEAPASETSETAANETDSSATETQPAPATETQPAAAQNPATENNSSESAEAAASDNT